MSFRITDDRVALLAVGLFVFHPLQTEPVNYIFARATILTTLFCLLAWAAWIDSRYSRATIYFALALLAKEEAAALPAFLFGYEYLYQGHKGAPRREWIRPLGAMLLLTAAAAARLVYVARVTAGSGALFDLGEITPFNYLLTQARAVWLYLRLLVFPVGLNFDRDFALSTGLGASTVVAWFALIALIVFAAWRVRKQSAWFWLLGGLLLLLPTSSFLPLADLVAERRLYLPLVSLSLGLAVLLAKMPRAVGIIVLLLAAGLSAQRSLVYQTEESLWRDTAQKSPNKIRPKLQLARAFGTSRPPRAGEQLALLSEAKKLAPSDPDVATEFGVFYLQSGDAAQAKIEFDVVIEQAGRTPSALANSGAAYFLLGDAAQAVETFTEALRKDPCHFDARNNLLLIYRRQDKQTKAADTARLPPECHLPLAQQRALAAARQEITTRR